MGPKLRYGCHVNGAQLHLLINHFPVILPILGALLILIGTGLRSWHLTETGLWILIVGALSSIPVYLTGSSAEAVVKNYPGISRNLIHDHEEAAELALIALSVTAVCGAVLLYGLRSGRGFARKGYSLALTLVLALASFVLVARAAHLGGFIRHEEIRSTDRF